MAKRWSLAFQRVVQMAHRFYSPLLWVVAMTSVASIPLRAQAPPEKLPSVARSRDASKPPAPLRTAWGQPDLQGTWTFKTITPLERPANLAGKEFLSEQEAAELERRAARTNTDEDRPADAAQDVAGAYNNFWFDRGDRVVKNRRSSLIVDPPDGRLPALTPEARKRVDARVVARDRPAHGPEDRSQFERCITRGLPRLPGGYNQNLQILQTPQYVAILYEMMREARIIPLDGRAHAGPNVRQWMGDSTGRWEGNTLVVETTNFNDKQEFRGASQNLRLVERFTRVDGGSIEYQLTAEDPSAWTTSWTAAIPLTKTEDQMYEYACHEGNYGMPNLLSSARAEDKAAVAADKQK
jgi:hypothetical protein